MTTDADRVFTRIILATLMIAIAVALASCRPGEVPLFVTTSTPAIPPECQPGNPVVRQVRADLPDGWASDAAAIRDREAWRSAYRDAQGQRVACFDRLQVLLPQPPAPAPAPRAVAKAPAR
jgi:hypothetical protein